MEFSFASYISLETKGLICDSFLLPALTAGILGTRWPFATEHVSLLSRRDGFEVQDQACTCVLKKRAGFCPSTAIPLGSPWGGWRRGAPGRPAARGRAFVPGCGFSEGSRWM